MTISDCSDLILAYGNVHYYGAHCSVTGPLQYCRLFKLDVISSVPDADNTSNTPFLT